MLALRFQTWDKRLKFLFSISKWTWLPGLSWMAYPALYPELFSSGAELLFPVEFNHFGYRPLCTSGPPGCCTWLPLPPSPFCLPIWQSSIWSSPLWNLPDVATSGDALLLCHAQEQSYPFLFISFSFFFHSLSKVN